jgi:hypothetical protein
MRLNAATTSASITIPHLKSRNRDRAGHGTAHRNLRCAPRQMLKCALCGRRLEPTAAWKGRGEQYYCNGFCAEAEQVDWPPLAASELPAIEERGHA